MSTAAVTAVAGRVDGSAGDPPHLARLRDLAAWRIARGHADVRGWAVQTADGQQVGAVADCIVDVAAGRVCYLDVARESGQSTRGGARWGDDGRTLLLPVANVEVRTADGLVVVAGSTLRQIAALTRGPPHGDRDANPSRAAPTPAARRGAGVELSTAVLVTAALALTAAAASGRPAASTGLDVDRMVGRAAIVRDFQVRALSWPRLPAGHPDLRQDAVPLVRPPAPHAAHARVRAHVARARPRRHAADAPRRSTAIPRPTPPQAPGSASSARERHVAIRKEAVGPSADAGTTDAGTTNVGTAGPPAASGRAGDVVRHPTVPALDDALATAGVPRRPHAPRRF